MFRWVFCVFIVISHSQADYSTDPWYPTYHLASRDGFMNDPNGLIQFDGYYHAFFQHSPGNVSINGIKHWGHARSKDMLTWEYLEEALSPSTEDDIDGCYSGSAIEDENGILHLMYTGVSTVNGVIHQVQCLASSEDQGLTFSKQGKILESDDYFTEFRDPKVWKEGESYYAVIVALNSTDNTERGQIMLYKSANLVSWESQGILAGPIDNLGFMWECPDIFTVNGQQILSFSAEDKNTEGTIYGWRSGYMLGTWQPGDKGFKNETPFTLLDYGFDFYAAQTFLTLDDRRIMIGWMNTWDTPYPESANGWVGTLTLPREITIDPNGRLLANPIKEIEDLRGELNNVSTITVEENGKPYFLETASNLTKELKFDWGISASDASVFGFQITDDSEDEGFFLFVNKTSEELVIRRNYPKQGFPSEERMIKIDTTSNLSTRIFLDHSTIEIFVNDGEVVISSRIYPNEDQKDLSLFSKDGTAVFDNVIHYDIKV